MKKSDLPTGKQKIIGYCRVSTDNQKEEGTIEIQQHALKDYAESRGYDLVETFSDEGVSGGLENRPALAAMFNYLERQDADIHAVLIYKLDRLARDLYIQEHLIKKLESLNVGLISTKEPDLASDDPMRKAFRQFMGIVSELEKAFITMRLSAGRENKIKNKGKFPGGGVAMGYKSKDKDLIIDDAGAGIIRRIFNLRKKHKQTLDRIAQVLNRENVPTARGGKKWYARTIKYILENPIYAGIMTYNGIEAQRADLALF